jgi:nicotinamide-nucleotide amidase
MPLRAEVIAIGDELTCGLRLDTNSQWISQRLGELGIAVQFHTTAGDDLEADVQVLRQALQRAEIVISTGGLGPTADDLTRDAIARAVGVDLVRDDAVVEHIRALFARRKRVMPERNVVQAMFPRGSRVIPNPNGTAPGIDLACGGPGGGAGRLFALPGVPAEVHDMWQGWVRPQLLELLGADAGVICHRVIRCFGAGESEIEQMLPDLVRRGREPSVGITASRATISLRITAAGPTPEACAARIDPTAATIYDCLGDLIFGEGDDQLQDVVVRELAARGHSLATFDCDTAGMLGRWLSEADSRQRVYRGGLTVRNPAAATGLLGSLDALVLGEAAWLEQIAQRCRERFATDYVLAIGPFPSPADAAPTAPDVPLVLVGPSGSSVHTTSFAGHPDIVVARVVKSALNFVRLQLRAGI